MQNFTCFKIKLNIALVSMAQSFGNFVFHFAC